MTTDSPSHPLPDISVQPLDAVVGRLLYLHDSLSLHWREIAAMPEFAGVYDGKERHVPAGTLSSIAKGRDPKDAFVRHVLHLPALATIHPCTVCGGIHIKSKCPTTYKPREKRMHISVLEAYFQTFLIYRSIPAGVMHFRFHPTRRLEFDFAWPEQKIAVELEGGIWTHGAHVRGVHYESDCEKYNEANLLGWKVYRFTSKMLEDGRADKQIFRIFNLPEV